jgi:hypothetical protein
MDLRHRKLTPAQIEELHLFIRQRKLAYQPFIFTDTLQVGEGQRFRDGEFAEKCGDVLWEGHPPDLDSADNLITKDAAAFQEANHELRKIYDGMVDFIVKHAGADISQLSFAEFGCNTGYFLHSLALRGAGKTIGYDFTPSDAIFRWFNDVLGIPHERNEFRFAEWDSLDHCVRHCTFDEVDVCMSIAVTTHLADPVHHLAYLCSKARKAVFFWVQVDNRDDLSITFGTPGKYPNPLSFPINFDNNIRLSPALLRLTLEQCGFENLIEIEPPDVSPRFQRWFKSQKGIMALRTSRPATLYAGGRHHRTVYGDVPPAAYEPRRRTTYVEAFGASSEEAPPDLSETPVLVVQGYRGFNIVRFQRRFIAVHQAVGAMDLASVDDAWVSAMVESRNVCAAESLDAVKRQIDQVTIDGLRALVSQQEQKLSELVLQMEQADRSWLPGRFATIRRKQVPELAR